MSFQLYKFTWQDDPCRYNPAVLCVVMKSDCTLRSCQLLVTTMFEYKKNNKLLLFQNYIVIQKFKVK